MTLAKNMPFQLIVGFVLAAHVLLLFCFKETFHPSPTKKTKLSVQTIALIPKPVSTPKPVSEPTHVSKPHPKPIDEPTQVSKPPPKPVSEPTPAPLPKPISEPIVSKPPPKPISEPIVSKPPPKPISEPIVSKPPPKPVSAAPKKTKPMPKQTKKNPPLAQPQKKPAPQEKPTQAPVSNAMLAKVKENLGKIDMNSAKVSLKSDFKGLSESTLQVQERAYRDELAARLKLMLRLPEAGEVNLKLTLARKGEVLKMEILSSESALNRSYIEKNLPQIKMPAFDNLFGTVTQYTFTITMRGDS